MGPGRTVTIEKITVSPNGDRLVLATAIPGVGGRDHSIPEGGDVYVDGHPEMDKSRQVGRLDRLDYDEGTTRGSFGRGWIARPPLESEGGLGFLLAEPAEEARKALGDLLRNRKSEAAWLSPGRPPVALESVAVTEEGLALLIRAEGSAHWSGAPVHASRPPRYIPGGHLLVAARSSKRESATCPAVFLYSWVETPSGLDFALRATQFLGGPTA